MLHLQPFSARQSFYFLLHFSWSPEPYGFINHSEYYATFAFKVFCGVFLGGRDQIFSLVLNPIPF